MGKWEEFCYDTRVSQNIEKYKFEGNLFFEGL